MIAAQVRAAKLALNQDPEGRLQAYCRRRIWLALGERDNLPTVMSAAHRCRAYLALACAAKVLPLWEERWRRRKAPRQMLEAALEATRRGTDLTKIKPDADGLWTAAEDLQYQFGPAPSIEVGFAMARAANVVYHDEIFRPEDGVDQVMDPQKDPWSWDAAYIAAEAHAHHFGSSAQVVAFRRAFWLDYLDHTLPQALEQAQLPLV